LYIRQSEENLIKKYFRLKYIDEASEETLILFLKEINKFSSMCVWKVIGICKESEFDEDLEFLGKNRNWYESPTEQSEIVKEKVIVKNNKYYKTYKLTGLEREVENAIQNGGNKRNSK